MRILLLAPQPFFSNRGTPIAVKLLCEVLAGQGHRIDLLTYHEGEPVNIPNLSIHRTPSLPFINQVQPGPSWKKIICDLFMLIESIRIMSNHKFDLIHAVEESVFIAVLLKWLYRIPFVYDMDSSLAQQIADKYGVILPLKFLMEAMERMAVRNSAGVIAVCKHLEQKAWSYATGKPILRLEDVSLLDFPWQPAEDSGTDLGIKSPVIMYVGNLEKYQGIDLLLDSFRFAANRAPEAQLVIVGGSAEDIERYRHKSNQSGIGERTHFIGPKPISQLAHYLKQADILVSPRLQGENTPMKIYSYLDSGTPVLATRLPTHTQVLDEEIVLLVPPDPEAMAEGLVRLLEDRELGTLLACRAKERVKQEFSPEAFRRKLLSFYQLLENDLSINGRIFSGLAIWK